MANNSFFEKKVSTIEDGNTLVHWYCRFLIVINSIKSFGLQQSLTLITMAIGSLGLSATMFLGQGALDGLWVDLDRLMGNRVQAYADAGPGDVLLKKRPNSHFTASDLKIVKEKLSSSRYVVPMITGRAQVAHKENRMIMSIDGITQELELEPAYVPQVGTYFSPSARDGFELECLITTSAAKKLNTDINQKISIDNYSCDVVAVVPDPPEADERFKSRVIIPYFWAQLFWGSSNNIGSIMVSWNSPQEMEQTVNTLRKVLDDERARGAYHLSSSQFAIKKRKNIVSNFMVFGAIQSIFSIVVASIGIVNVMLANVVRRSKEFAVRIAMGAYTKDIAIIVISESFLLGIIGAGIGVLMAIILAPVVSHYISAVIPEASNLKPIISMHGILAPIAVCGLSGLIAGIIPAFRACKVDVLAVLRAE